MLNRIPLLALFISVLALFPLLGRSHIDFGQLGKQTFAAEMIQSAKNGEVVAGLFPIRHFLEPYHEDLIPWAEEVPLYTFAAANLSKYTSLTVEASGKLLSFLSFLILILGFYQIRKSLVFAMTAALFPAFRLYSVQIMPDVAMTAACVWAIAFALQNKPKRSALLILLASVLKYYAVFTGFGLGLYYLYRWQKTRDSKFFTQALWLSLAVTPCILYIAYFLKLGIPNPITEYRTLDGHGHLASIAGLLSFHKWLRVLTWLFIKNSSVFGTLLAVMGLGAVLKNQDLDSEKPLFWCLLLGWSVFPLVFIESFYVHDYYGLQASIGTAIFAGFGLESLKNRSARYFIGASVIFLIWSIVHIHGMTRSVEMISKLKSEVDRQNPIDRNQYVMTISGISKPTLIYNLGLKGWISGIDEYFEASAQKRMSDPRIQSVLVLDFKSSGETKRVIDDLAQKGFRTQSLHSETAQETFTAFRH